MRRILTVLFLSGSLGCGPLAHIGETFPTHMFITQRSVIDCGVAGLAMLLGEDYDTIAAALPAGLLLQQGGLTDANLQTTAASLGRPVRIERLPPGSTLTGSALYHIAFTDGWHHYVMVWHGVIYDPLSDLPESRTIFASTHYYTVYSRLLLDEPMFLEHTQ